MTHPQDMSLREQARAVGSGELDPEKAADGDFGTYRGEKQRSARGGGDVSA